MLLPIEINLVSKKRGYKRNLAWPSDFCGGKMVFILLAKVLIIYMEPTAVDVWGLGLEFVS